MDVIFRNPVKWLTVMLVLLIALITTSQAVGAQAEEAEWLVMLYLVADDNQLEQDILIDFNEAEMIGSTDSVHVVAQVDRYSGGFDGMEDWDSTKRYYLTADGDLNEISSEELADLGEANMADGETLTEFITWAVENYPAQKHALVMSDHGIGWVGGFGDPDPGIAGAHDLFLLDWFEYDMLWLMEIDAALEAARTATGIEQFDLVTLDVCLMGQLEVFTALAPHTQYAVASEEVVPGVGMAYASFLQALTTNPAMDGAGLAEAIVASFLVDDQRLYEEDFSGGASVEVIAEALSYDSTLTAVDTAQIPNLNQMLDEFVANLQTVDPRLIAEARAYTQAYESPFGDEFPSSFIDLGHFALLMVELTEGDMAIAQAADNLIAAIRAAIVAEKHGPGRPGSTGFAIYFPTPNLYAIADNLEYTRIASRFAEESAWDEFLAAQSGTEQFVQPQAAPVAEADPEEEPLLPEGVSEEEVTEAIEFTAYYMDQEGWALAEIPDLLLEDGFSEETISFLVELGIFAEEGAEEPEAIASSATWAGPKPLQIAPLTLSASVATITTPLEIDTTITGDNLAYVYQFVGRFLPRRDVLLYEDIDYIGADEDKTVGGVTYPNWEESPLELTVEWEPIVYNITDGTQSVKALIAPEKYGAAPSYATQGVYEFVDGSLPRFAKLFFRDANGDDLIEMTHVLGYSGGVLTDSVGAPREIYPQPGDSFTVLEIGEDYETDGEYRELGETLLFGEDQFYIDTELAPSGNYVIGLIAEDLNGNEYEAYEQIFVHNPEAAAVDGFVPYINEELGFAMLYPEPWVVDEEPDGVFVTRDDDLAFSFITTASYTETASLAMSSDMAVNDAADLLLELESFENITFIDDITDTVLGPFDARSVEFSFDLDDTPFYGEIIAATPQPGLTYILIIAAPDDEYDTILAESFDPLIYSFDLFVTSEYQEAGPLVPEFAELLFSDDFSDPTSGLYDEPEWDEGISLQYLDDMYQMELPPYGGPLYDYYLEQELPDTFMLEVAASYSGAIDNGYGLVFQVVEEGDNFYAFRISGDGFYTVEKLTTEGELETLIDWTASDLIDMEEEAWNFLTVVGDNGSYDLYINGFQVDSFTDTDLSGGSFGPLVDNFADQAPVSFAFDDLQLGTIE